MQQKDVDLTRCDLVTGNLLPMRGGLDLMDPISHHRSPGLTPVEGGNRALLRALMDEAGFVAYDCE